METRHHAAAVAVVGAGLAAAPLYVDDAFAVGIGPALDPLAAVGLAPAGLYPLVVGVGYLVAGVLGLLFVPSQPLSYAPVRTAGLAVLVVALAAGAGYAVAVRGLASLATVLLPTLVVAAGLAPAAFVAGLVTGQVGRGRAVAPLAVLLLPALGAFVGRYAETGRTLPTAVVGLAVLATAAFGVIWGTPLYRLGRSFEVVPR